MSFCDNQTNISRFVLLPTFVRTHIQHEIRIWEKHPLTPISVYSWISTLYSVIISGHCSFGFWREHLCLRKDILSFPLYLPFDSVGLIYVTLTQGSGLLGTWLKQLKTCVVFFPFLLILSSVSSYFGTETPTKDTVEGRTLHTRSLSFSC
jgi:hypothetical protein